MDKYPSTESIELSKVYHDRPPFKPMDFYLLAVAKCPACLYEGLVKINRDGVIHHECDQGSVSARVPQLELTQPLVKNRKLRR